MKPLQVFIGYDSKEPIAYHVLTQSILRRASAPVSITPVALKNLGGIYTRERGPLESTEFSMTRFLVPYLSNYEGMSIFMDCDMVCLADIHAVMNEIVGPEMDRCHDDGCDHHCPAVWVAKHDYVPKAEAKFFGQQQTAYPRKNWSSFMVFDNAKCRALTPEYVNTASGLDLHRFNWLKDDQIGSLPLEWNWLVGEYAKNPAAKVLHYTLGGPWIQEYTFCDHYEEWLFEHYAARIPAVSMKTLHNG